MFYCSNFVYYAVFKANASDGSWIWIWTAMFFSSLSYLLTSFRHDSSIAFVNKSRLTLIHVIHLSKLLPKNPFNEIPNDHLEGKSPTCPWVEELDIDRSSHVFCQICCFNEIHFLRTHWYVSVIFLTCEPRNQFSIWIATRREKLFEKAEFIPALAPFTPLHLWCLLSLGSVHALMMHNWLNDAQIDAKLSNFPGSQKPHIVIHSLHHLSLLIQTGAQTRARARTRD